MVAARCARRGGIRTAADTGGFGQTTAKECGRAGFRVTLAPTARSNSDPEGNPAVGTGSPRGPAEASRTIVEAAAAVRSLEDLAGVLRDLRRRHARAHRGSSLTYRELAAQTGWSHAAIAEYFTAQTLAPTDRFDALLEVLGAGPAELRALADARDRVEETQRRAKGRRFASALTAASPGPGRGPGPGPGRTGTGTARQLPPDTALFTGRGEELAQLLALAERTRAGLAPGTAVISAIGGMGGAGKTALAIHAGHLLAEHYPDGQLFLDLYGFAEDRPPREPGEALAELLASLGVAPAQVPAQVDARAALYRDRLADTRTLVLLDNARDEDQVRALLPAGSRCLVLVTSRRRLIALDDAVPLPLGMLEREEAVELLRHAARAAPELAADARWERVAELCGRLPLALLIAGSLLRVGGKAWDLNRLVDRLALRRPGDELAGYTDETRSLTAVFDLSLRSLPDGEQLLFRRLGLAPAAEIDTYAAAALLDTDLDTAERLLERLADHSLLLGVAPGRYRMHDLLHVYARARANEIDEQADLDAAIERLLRYWAHTAQIACLLIADLPRSASYRPAPAHAPAMTSPDAALVWLRAERANLDAAFDYAHDRGGHDHLIALAAGMAEILRIDGPWSRALEIHQGAAEAAENSGDRTAQADALADFGRVRQLTGDYPGATDTYTRALKLYQDDGNRAGEAGALSGLGFTKRATGAYQESVDLLRRALEIHRELGNLSGEGYVLIDIGRMLQAGGEYAQAEQSESRALRIHRDLGDRAGEAYALYALGRVRFATGDYQRAAEAHTEALEIQRERGNRLGMANVLTELGRVRHATGEYAEAGAMLTGAMETYRKIGDRGDEGVAVNYYAATLAATGRGEEALALFQTALATHRELGKPDDEAVSLEGIADYHLAAGDPAEAAAYLRQALDIYERLGIAPDALRIRDRLLDVES